MTRVLFCTRAFPFDDSNGAAVAQRGLAALLARHGLESRILGGTAVDAGGGPDPVDVLAARGVGCRTFGGDSFAVGAGGVFVDDPARLEAVVDGVPTTVLRRPLRDGSAPDFAEGAEFLRLFDLVCDRHRPDALVTYGGDDLTLALLARARGRGIATVFALHNLMYHDAGPFADADAVVVPSRFAADHYRRALGLEAVAIPNPVDRRRVVAPNREPRFVTFVNPCPDKGLYPFARIADELGRRRPEIPLLVVESRGTRRDLDACGLDLRRHPNLHLMPQTHDPRAFWGLTRVGLVPSVFNESQGLVAAEALVNGIPVVASDRGALPETLGRAGVVLPLPDHLVPGSHHLPGAEEMAPWVEAVIRLWDDAGFFAAHAERAAAEAGRWDPDVLAPQYVRFFTGLRTG